MVYNMILSLEVLWCGMLVVVEDMDIQMAVVQAELVVPVVAENQIRLVEEIVL